MIVGQELIVLSKELRDLIQLSDGLDFSKLEHGHCACISSKRQPTIV